MTPVSALHKEMEKLWKTLKSARLKQRLFG